MRKVWVAAGWAWAAAIVWLSLTPSPPQIQVDQIDKLEHLAAYALLMFWFCQLYFGRNARLAYALGFIAMGVALEFVQRETGYRTFEVADMFANALGVLSGWAASRFLPRIKTS